MERPQDGVAATHFAVFRITHAEVQSIGLIEGANLIHEQCIGVVQDRGDGSFQRLFLVLIVDLGCQPAVQLIRHQ